MAVASGVVVGIGVGVSTSPTLTLIGGTSESWIKIEASIFCKTSVLRVGFRGFKIFSGTGATGLTVTVL